MEDLIEIKPTLSEKIAARQKKLSDSYEISLLYILMLILDPEALGDKVRGFSLFQN